MPDVLAEAHRLVSGYGNVRILDGIDLAVPAEGITALIGSNGAGKSTTLRALAGLLRAWEGDIRFEGAAVGHLACDARVALGIVLVPEGRMVFPGMTVEENLRLGAFSLRARSHARASIERIYAAFPRLKERRRQSAGTLSGGEQQMLAIGRGLMALPRLLLLDEPTLGLAPLAAQDIFRTIDTLSQDGMTILLAEQDVRRTLALAGEAYVLENGRVVARGSGNELLQRPDLKAAYLGI